MTIFESKLYDIIKNLADNDTKTADVFDEFCDKVDEICQKEGLKAYIRVFWDNDSETLADTLDEVCDIMFRFDVVEYVNIPSTDYDATFTVITYTD